MKKWINSSLLLLLVSFPVLSYATTVVPKVFHTKNNIPVYFVQRNNLPMLDIAVVFSAGSVRDGNQFGVASMTQDLMGHGTQSYSEKEISNIMGDTGAMLGSQLTKDMSVWTLRTLTERNKLKKSIAVLHSILVRPSFPRQVFKRLQGQLRLEVLQQQQDPMSLAKNTFFNTLFNGNPYGHSSLGTEQSIAQLTPADCQAFYKTYYVTQNSSIILVGDLSLKSAKRIANTLSHGMRSGVKAEPIEKIEAQKKENVFVPLRKAQTTLIMGQMGFPPYSKGYYARLIGNDIFGGSGLNSTLSDEVREKRGLAYFAYSQNIKLQGNGPFVMLSQSRAKNAAKTYKTMLDAYRSFLLKGVSSASLKVAKKSLIGRYQLANVSNASICSNLIATVFYGFPIDYFQTFSGKIKAVNRKNIVSGFAELKNKPLVAVMVGKQNAFPQEK